MQFLPISLFSQNWVSIPDALDENLSFHRIEYREFRKEQFSHNEVNFLGKFNLKYPDAILMISTVKRNNFLKLTWRKIKGNSNKIKRNINGFNWYINYCSDGRFFSVELKDFSVRFLFNQLCRRIC